MIRHIVLEFLINHSECRKLIFFLCFFFLFLATPHSMQDLISPIRIEPGSSAMEAQSPNHWTRRKVPCRKLKLPSKIDLRNIFGLADDADSDLHLVRAWLGYNLDI